MVIVWYQRYPSVGAKTQVFENDEAGIKASFDYNYTHAYDSGRSWWKRFEEVKESDAR